MAEVISFPVSEPRADTPVQEWPGRLIDLAQAREMAGVSTDEPELGEETPEGEAPSEITPARQIALRTLAARGRSVAEVRQKLRDRGIEESVVDEEISRLVTEGLLNDFDLAEQLVWSLQEHKKLGPVAIRQALIKRKIAAAVIDRVIPQVSDIEPDVIEQLARDRIRSMSGLEPDVQKRRLVGFLARRGYTGSEVYRAVDRAVGES
jgi:regulatory protein